MKVAIVIPAYNESNTISKVIRDVKQYGTVIVVDDASTDLTKNIAKNEGVIVVEHKTNLGYDAAIQSGFCKASSLKMNFVITFDADGQHDADVLLKFLDCFNSKDLVDIVIGVRSKPARMSEILFNMYSKFMYGVDDLLCGLKGYRMSSTYNKYGAFDTYNSIGTELTLFCLNNNLVKNTVHVEISNRDDGSRMGSIIRSNIGGLLKYEIY